jgi:hypothetical protein
VLPEQVVELAKQKKLRIVLGADREGGLMTGPCGDSTASTAAAIVRKNLPVDSLLVAQGNFKIAEQYIKWYSGTYRPKLFDVMYSNHFAQVVQELQLPNQLAISTAISNIESKDFSSLNRVYRSHRGAHVCALIRDNILDKGLVSFNSEFQEMQFTDHFAAKWCQIPVELYKHIMKPVSPKFIDGDWCSVNAANQYTLSIYQNSLMSFITETKFNEDVAFLTEKIFKPMAVGHPVIMLASAGTLKALRSLGFRTDWCGIDDSYNDIPDDGERFRATHKVLLDWVALPRDEKVTRIKNSLDTLEHNFNLMRERNR